jgi:hypothetical protein
MNTLKTNIIETNFKYLKFEEVDTQFVAILIDKVGDEIVKGYGATKIEAINDLHSCLI